MRTAGAAARTTRVCCHIRQQTPLGPLARPPTWSAITEVTAWRGERQPAVYLSEELNHLRWWPPSAACAAPDVECDHRSDCVAWRTPTRRISLRGAQPSAMVAPFSRLRGPLTWSVRSPQRRHVARGTPPVRKTPLLGPLARPVGLLRPHPRLRVQRARVRSSTTSAPQGEDSLRRDCPEGKKTGLS